MAIIPVNIASVHILREHGVDCSRPLALCPNPSRGQRDVFRANNCHGSRSWSPNPSSSRYSDRRSEAGKKWIREKMRQDLRRDTGQNVRISKGELCKTETRREKEIIPGPEEISFSQEIESSSLAGREGNRRWLLLSYDEIRESGKIVSAPDINIHIRRPSLFTRTSLIIISRQIMSHHDDQIDSLCYLINSIHMKPSITLSRLVWEIIAWILLISIFLIVCMGCVASLFYFYHLFF